MAVITPNTDVILLKVPLEINDNNQLTFANATAQYNYFNGLTKKTFEKFTYQRKDNTIIFELELPENCHGEIKLSDGGKIMLWDNLTDCTPL